MITPEKNRVYVPVFTLFIYVYIYSGKEGLLYFLKSTSPQPMPSQPPTTPTFYPTLFYDVGIFHSFEYFVTSFFIYAYN